MSAVLKIMQLAEVVKVFAAQVEDAGPLDPVADGILEAARELDDKAPKKKRS